MSDCPLVAWEKVKLSAITVKEASLAPAKAVVSTLARQFIANPILSAAIDAVEAGQDIAETAIMAGHNLIDSINKADWLSYAVSVTAREIYEVTQREISLIAAILAILNKSTQRGAASSRYARISAEAVRNVVIAKNLLIDAADADRFNVLYRYFNRALSIAEANHGLLSADAVKYIKNKSAVSLATQITESVTEGKIKRSSEAVEQKLIANAVSGATGIIRSAAIDELDKAVIKIARISRITYMYSGLNYSPMVYEARMEINSIMSRLETSINEAMVKEAYPLGGGSALRLDEAISQAASDISKIQKSITGKIVKRGGYYLFSMSPDFNPGDDLFSVIEDNNVANALSSSDAVGMLLNISPYSDTPNNSLTIYGSNLKLPILIDSLNVCAAALVRMAKESLANEAGSEELDELSSIKDSLRVAGDSIDIEPYVFSDALGMSVARLEAGNLKSRLARMRKNEGIDRAAQKLNNEDYLSSIRKLVKNGVEKKIHEPALGLALLLGYCLKSLLPSGISNSDYKNLRGLLNDRLEYLRGINGQVSPLKDYRDIGCEAVIEELSGSGLGFVAEAAKYGKIATGAVSLVAGVGGLAKTIYDIASSCLPLVPDAQRHKDIQKGVKNIKEGINKSINAGMASALKPLGIPVQLISGIKIASQESQRLTAKISEMSESASESITG